MRLRAQSIFGTLLTLSILTSAFAPQRALQADEVNTLSAAFHSQSTIINLCIASSIPLKIINAYLVEHGLAASAGGNTAPRKPLRNEPDTATTALTEQSVKLKSTAKSGAVPGSSGMNSVFVFRAPACSEAPLGNLPAGAAACIMLLFFFLLPRSSISDNAVIHFCAY